MDLFKHIYFVGDMIVPGTLILCDNGNKINEVRLLSERLSGCCVIMAHDYFYSKEEFEQMKTWPSCEITWNDIADLGLKPYHQDIMKKGFWLSLTNIE